MQKNKQQIIIGIGYYILAVLTVLFFYREDSVSSEFVQMICAVIFLFVLPMILIKKGMTVEKETINHRLREHNWPVGYIKKQLVFSTIFIWGGSLLFWIFMLQWGGEGKGNELIWRNGQTIKLILINSTIVPVGLLAQEFFFRGFLLKIFKDYFNKAFAVGIVALLAGVFSMILVQSIFKWQVVVGMFIVNVFLGLVAIKFRSVIASFFVYWLVIVVLNLYTLYQLSQNLK